MQLSMRSDIRQTMRSLNKIERSVLPKATSASINKVGDKARTQVFRYVAKESGAKQKDLKRRGYFTVYRSSIRKPTFRINVNRGAIPLKDFNPRQTARGVTAKAWGKSKLYKSAFVSEKLGRHVFVRKTGARYPLKKLYGSQPSKIAAEKPLELIIGRLVKEDFSIIMRRNIAFYANKELSRRRR